MRQLADTLQSWDFKVCSVFLIDTHFVLEAEKFIAGALTALSAMISLEVSAVNVLSKMDLLSERNKALVEEFLDADTRNIMESGEENVWNKKHRRLTEAISTVLEDYSMVKFVPLDINDEEVIEQLLLTIDISMHAVYSKMSSLTEAETATAELKEAKLAEDTLEEEGDGQQTSSEDMQMDTSERAVKIEEDEQGTLNSQEAMEVDEKSKGSGDANETAAEMDRGERQRQTQTQQSERSEQPEQPLKTEEVDEDSKLTAASATVTSTHSQQIEETDSNESGSRASSRTDLTKEDIDLDGMKLPKRKKDRPQVPSIMCSYRNFDGVTETGCKQRAILGFKFCIRHILNDPSAPYVQCQHHRKPKTKKDLANRCTNAIKIRENGETDKFCSTHLIMNGMKEAKRKVPLSSATAASALATNNPSTSAMPNHCLSVVNPMSSGYLNGDDVNRRELTVGEVYQADLKDTRGRGMGRYGAGKRPQSAVNNGNAVGSRFLLPEQSKAFLNRLSPEEKIRLKTKLGGLLKKNCAQEWSIRDRHILQVKTIIQLIKIPSAELQKRLLKSGRNIPLPVLQFWRQTMANKMMAIRMSRFPLSHLIKYPQIATRLLASGTIRNPKHREALDQIRSSALTWILSPTKTAAMSTPLQAQPSHLAQSTATMQQQMGDSAGIAADDSSMIRVDANGHPLPVAKPVIKIRQKRQCKKMVGIYRMIPGIEPICQMLEETDFDRTDLFPLGLEPSDDEDEELPQLPISSSFHSLLAEQDPLLQTYLLKKQLRLERQTLIREAQINAPIMQSIRKFPNSVGAILRQRHEEHIKPAQRPAECIRRCAYFDQNTKEKCDRTCIPQSNHCNFHISMNVNQKQFSYCAESCCRKPVNSVDAWLWDGKCELHRESRDEKYGPAPIYEDEEESGEEETESSAMEGAEMDANTSERHEESDEENWEQLHDLMTSSSRSSSVSPQPTNE
ncbi:hypothetical protein WR25_04583 [Diploscapter pachys]|uniref:KANL2-like probable zinc-finger domain-containing protein n=1 Tax=Diploscapter pachys TaxID=2018661 RepID=A0A2A2LL19_9BILA|nr:hypothetical protein WR25_04583 [Diploscapter pachys]